MPHDVGHPDDRFIGPWFDTHTAAAYVGNKTLKGYWAWRRRHHIVARGPNGRVAKRDLDRALRVPRKRSKPHVNSLANLSKRKVA